MLLSSVAHEVVLSLLLAMCFHCQLVFYIVLRVRYADDNLLYFLLIAVHYFRGILSSYEPLLNLQISDKPTHDKFVTQYKGVRHTGSSGNCLHADKLVCNTVKQGSYQQEWCRTALNHAVI